MLKYINLQELLFILSVEYPMMPLRKYCTYFFIKKKIKIPILITWLYK